MVVVTRDGLECTPQSCPYISYLKEGLSLTTELAILARLTIPKLPGSTCLYLLELVNTRDTHKACYTDAATKLMISPAQGMCRYMCSF